MAGELRSRLEAHGILETPTYRVVAQEDSLALVKADLGVAIIPVGVVETSVLCRIPLKQLNLVRKVSVYTVAGRHRAIACATLFNALRAADWGFDTGTKQQRRAYR